MKKFISLLVLSIVLTGVFQMAEAQVDKRKMRRANRQISTFTQAKQFSKVKQYVTVGVHVGTGTYFGDLAPTEPAYSFDPRFTRPSFGVYGTKRVHPNIALRAMFSWVRIQGDDFTPQGDLSNRDKINRYLRNHHFRNDIKELSLGATFDLYGNNSTYIRRKTGVNPYGFASVSFFHHNPRALAPIGSDEEGTWVALQPLGTEGQGREGYAKKYSLFQIGVPLGVGLKYRLTDQLDLAFEIGYRITFSRYLDDVGGTFANPADFEAGSLAQQMAFRSAEEIAARTEQNRNIGAVSQVVDQPIVTNSGATYVSGWGGRNQIRGGGGRDYYMITGFHLSYILGSQTRAPKFR